MSPAVLRVNVSVSRTSYPYCTTDAAHTEATHVVAASSAPVWEHGKGHPARVATRAVSLMVRSGAAPCPLCLWLFQPA